MVCWHCSLFFQLSWAEKFVCMRHRKGRITVLCKSGWQVLPLPTRGSALLLGEYYSLCIVTTLLMWLLWRVRSQRLARDRLQILYVPEL